MLITRTPLRVSFLGGGSDYLRFFEQSPGHVLGTTVNLYVYVSIVEQSKFSQPNFRLSYSTNEEVDRVEDFRHPVVRETLKLFNTQNKRLHIATQADVPARTGLGSSSSFTVGLINALNHMNFKPTPKEEMALSAIKIEREILKEEGGWQDQYHAAFGGLGLYSFSKTSVERKEIDNSEFLQNSMLLVSAGSERSSSTFAQLTQEYFTTEGFQEAQAMANLSLDTYRQIVNETTNERRLDILGEALRKSWEIKRKIRGMSLNPRVNEVLEIAQQNGALGGKLCGAGGSGFVLLLANPTEMEKLEMALSNHQFMRVQPTRNGSSIEKLGWNK